MARKWLKHGKWPRVLVNLHYYTIVTFPLLLLTGVALWAPALHAPLIPYLPYIYQFHILLGLVFGITLLLPLFRLIPSGKTIWRLDWWFPIVFGAAIVLTGILLWQVTWFGAAWRSASFKWHGDLSYLLGIWLLIHATFKVVSYRPEPDGWAGRVNPDRRRFLGYLGTGVAGMLVLTVLDPFAALGRLFRPPTGQVGGGTQSSSGLFGAYYTVTGGYPTVALADYRLTVDGLVEHPLHLSWQQLSDLPSTVVTHDFQCVTGWSVPNVRWAGVHLRELVSRAVPSPDVQYVHFYSFDGAYTESMPLKEAMDATVLLAYSINHAPLPTAQGFPLRLVVPKMYGYKSIKWVNRVEFHSKPIVGYWEQRGYASEAYIGRGLL